MGIPIDLRDLKSWHLWKSKPKKGKGNEDKQPDKQPVDRYGTDASLKYPPPDMLNDYETTKRIRDAEPALNTQLGLNLSGRIVRKLDGATLIGLDYDGCLGRDGVPMPWAEKSLGLLPRTYTEITPSKCSLRAWYWVHDADHDLGNAKVVTFTGDKREANAAPGVPLSKSVELQILGNGDGAGFATFTGHELDGYPATITTIKTIEPLIKHHGLRAKINKLSTELRPGTGPVLSVEQTRELLKSHKHFEVIENATHWQSIIPDDKIDRSASAAFSRVVVEVLKVNGCHGEAAVDYLLQTGWKGVEDSADASRYGRRSWVSADVARVQKFDIFDRPDFVALLGAHELTEVQMAKFEADVAAHNERAEAREAKARSGYKLRSAFDMMTDPPVEWLVKGYVSEASVGLLAGESGTGKSGLLIDLVGHLLHGRKWLGKRTAPGSVIWFAGEGKRDIGPRLKAWHQRHDIDPMLPEGRYFAAVDEIIDPLTGEKGLTRLRATLEEAKATYGNAPALVALDTLSSLWGGESENDTAEAAKWLKRLLDIAEEFGCTFMLVHHLAKPPQSTRPTKARVPTMASVRGASAFAANVDFVLAMGATGEHASELHNLKQRSERKAAPAAFDIVAEKVGTDSHGETVTAMVVVRGVAADEAKAKAEAEASTIANEAKDLQKNIARVVAAAAKLGPEWHAKTAITKRAAIKNTVGGTAIEIATASEYGLLESDGKGRPRYRITDAGRASLRAK